MLPPRERGNISHNVFAQPPCQKSEEGQRGTISAENLGAVFLHIFT